MTPAARLQAAIDILALATDQPLERQAKAFWRERRYAGGGDRRAVGEMLFTIARGRAHFAHRIGSDAPRALVIAALLAEGRDVESLFTGGYGPAPLTDAERAAIAAAPPPEPLWVQGEFPQFLESELRRAFGDQLLQEMAALASRAPVDLRVNTLKARRDDVLAALQADGVTCEAMAYAPNGIRCAADTRNLDKHAFFLSGAFEIQDQASQIAAILCGAQPGMSVLDIAAGAGGKSLALAAIMQNQGVITASDIRGAALAELEKRSSRAGATNIQTHVGTAPPGLHDVVLLDAPCSGSGTWRRQPGSKWRLTPERLAQLMALQDDLLDQAAARAKTRLVYATCSVLPCENEDRLAAFAVRHPGWAIADATQSWPGAPVPGLTHVFQATPAKTGTDGFFCAILTRVPA